MVQDQPSNAIKIWLKTHHMASYSVPGGNAFQGWTMTSCHGKLANKNNHSSLGPCWQSTYLPTHHLQTWYPTLLEPLQSPPHPPCMETLQETMKNTWSFLPAQHPALSDRDVKDEWNGSDGDILTFGGWISSCKICVLFWLFYVLWTIDKLPTLGHPPLPIQTHTFPSHTPFRVLHIVCNLSWVTHVPAVTLNPSCHWSLSH